jgi:hypothetical protein
VVGHEVGALLAPNGAEVIEGDPLPARLPDDRRERASRPQGREGDGLLLITEVEIEKDDVSF